MEFCKVFNSVNHSTLDHKIKVAVTTERANTREAAFSGKDVYCLKRVHNRPRRRAKWGSQGIDTRTHTPPFHKRLSTKYAQPTPSFSWWYQCNRRKLTEEQTQPKPSHASGILRWTWPNVTGQPLRKTQGSEMGYNMDFPQAKDLDVTVTGNFKP